MNAVAAGLHPDLKRASSKQWSPGAEWALPSLGSKITHQTDLISCSSFVTEAGWTNLDID